ncbi:MAG: endonuclease/exonuclease/phosphatase family protein [Acidimicrobiia bacterium]|nr:endonuclease/exonuclease/phosphatase family protein [Acidimicrobiia bacterium]
MCAAAVMFMVAAPVSATSGVTVVDAKVMSQNLYIGADLDRILRGEDPAAVFQTVLESNVLERFATFAAQVDAENPDLIGLQEVTKIVVFDAQGNILQDIDYLDIVLGNLAARGESFAVSSVVANADVTLPLDLQAGLFARVIDRDVIIHNTATTAVSNPESANYATNFAFNLGGIDIEFTRGYTAVDAVVSGSSFRFVNTHLEVQNAPCLPPTGLAICQEVQAAELVEALAGESLPVVLLGDFNAEPGEPTYETIVDGGYADTWNNEGGDTCCQSELLNEPSDLTQRIDIIFHGAANASLISATTNTVTAQTPGGLWYSDHAGVVADLRLLVTDICAGLTPTIEGTAGGDLIFGTSGNDIIFTYGGDDTIFGRSGNDIICSGDGDDVISASDGDDRVDAGSGDDTVYSGDGDDLVVAVTGDNTITGGWGDDHIIAGQGDDTVFAGGGDDVVDVGDGANTVVAGPGDDDVTGGTDGDQLFLGFGDDVARSGAGDDQIYGGPGDDTVDAGAGTDTCSNVESSVGCEL